MEPLPVDQLPCPEALEECICLGPNPAASVEPPGPEALYPRVARAGKAQPRCQAGQGAPGRPLGGRRGPLSRLSPAPAARWPRSCAPSAPLTCGGSSQLQPGMGSASAAAFRRLPRAAARDLRRAPPARPLSAAAQIRRPEGRGCRPRPFPYLDRLRSPFARPHWPAASALGGRATPPPASWALKLTWSAKGKAHPVTSGKGNPPSLPPSRQSSLPGNRQRLATKLKGQRARSEEGGWGRRRASTCVRALGECNPGVNPEASWSQLESASLEASGVNAQLSSWHAAFAFEPAPYKGRKSTLRK